MLVEKKDSKIVYALKSLRKEDIIDKDQVEHTKTERYVLESVHKVQLVLYAATYSHQSSCPFLVNLEYAFQTPEKVFFVMKFMRWVFRHALYLIFAEEESFSSI